MNPSSAHLPNHVATVAIKDGDGGSPMSVYRDAECEACLTTLTSWESEHLKHICFFCKHGIPESTPP